MVINIYFKNIEPTSAIKEYVEKKIKRVLKKLYHVEGVQVRFQVEREEQVCEITIQGDNTVYHIREKEKDLYAAIDLAIDSLEHKVTLAHKKREKREKEPVSWYEEEKDRVEIEKVEVPFKPMDDYEAFLQLKSNGYKFLLYHPLEEKRFRLLLPDIGKRAFLYVPVEGMRYEKRVVREEEEEGLRILKKEEVELPVLSLEEAQKRRKDKDFLFFLLKGEGDLCVLYRKGNRILLQCPPR